MKMIIIMMITMPIMMTMVNHPLSMGLILILQTIMVSMMMSLMLNSPWYSYVLVLIMLGGMLVLFMYMASIASNEIMKFSLKMTMTSILIMMTSYIIIEKEMFQKFWKSNIMDDNNQLMSLMKLFNTQTWSMTIMMAIYLLITMIIVVYITNVFEGPMRKKN